MLQVFKAIGPVKNNQYLIMGDFVDRGKHSIECMCLLLALKNRYPKQIHLLRGNHESTSISRIYGFYSECKRRYSVPLWKEFCSLFNYLPFAALVDDRILCMHGGLSPELTRKNKEGLGIINSKIKRPIEVPERGILTDLLWADPSINKNQEKYEPNDRGMSFTFGKPILDKFCDEHELDLICRAH